MNTLAINNDRDKLYVTCQITSSTLYIINWWICFCHLGHVCHQLHSFDIISIQINRFVSPNRRVKTRILVRFRRNQTIVQPWVAIVKQNCFVWMQQNSRCLRYATKNAVLPFTDKVFGTLFSFQIHKYAILKTSAPIPQAKSVICPNKLFSFQYICMKWEKDSFSAWLYSNIRYSIDQYPQANYNHPML